MEAPALARIQTEYRSQGLEVIAVNLLLSAPLEYWRQYWRRVGGGDVVYAQDTRREAVRELRIQTAGATVVIDRQGRIVWRDLYASPYVELQAAVEKAL
ncbi:MAG: hypothetical protein O6934_12395 [SAR324 cluster bacterium]|nr:hypothetical protein [SAR324 cluster bacterium]